MTVTSWSFSISSRARFQPTLPAPAMITYSAVPPSAPPPAPPRRAARSRSGSGRWSATPCSAYQAARRGSSTRAITFGTSKRRWAICETTRFVLSPLVEAMKTSASSMPASISASISSAVPIVKRPPASSQPWPSSTSRRSWESGSSSRTETVWPARRAAVATEDPTLPAPTTSTNIGADSSSPGRLGRVRIRDAAVLGATGRSCIGSPRAAARGASAARRPRPLWPSPAAR